MSEILIGTLIALHGLAHLWYLVLSQRMVAFQPAMGWTGKSWLLTSFAGDTNTRSLAAFLYTLAALSLTVGAVGLMRKADWSHPWLIGSALVSAITIIIFWDRDFNLIIEKGLGGLIISLGLIAFLLLG